MKRSLWLSLTVIVLAVSACNTVEGVGRDISGGANVVRGWFSQ